MVLTLDKETSLKAIARIQQLTPASSALWGTMDVAQMLAHNNVAFKIALGELQLKRNLLYRLMGKLIKKGVLGPAAFEKNLQTVPAFLIADKRDFEKEKQELLRLISAASKGTSPLGTYPHPVFGHLTRDEWNRWLYKHLDHHLRQFGV